MGRKFEILNKSRSCFAVAGLALLLLIMAAGCVPLQSLLQDPRYLYEDGALLVDGNNQPIELINNPDAVNVNYAALLEFIQEDSTDQYEYIARGTISRGIPFVCSDFAETVHNNAESAGIRAGYVSVEFEDGGLGHAINAFETTDRGLVYIDCTGKSVYSQLDGEGISTSSWDKVAYIEEGKKYGVIGLDKARYPFYEFFEEFEQRWQVYRERLKAFNAEVERYNQEIKGKVYREGSLELANLRLREAELIREEKILEGFQAELGDSRFKSLGIVGSTFIHW